MSTRDAKNTDCAKPFGASQDTIRWFVIGLALVEVLLIGGALAYGLTR
jgi:hypothetical protein